MVVGHGLLVKPDAMISWIELCDSCTSYQGMDLLHDICCVHV